MATESKYQYRQEARKQSSYAILESDHANATDNDPGCHQCQERRFNEGSAWAMGHIAKAPPVSACLRRAVNG